MRRPAIIELIPTRPPGAAGRRLGRWLSSITRGALLGILVCCVGCATRSRPSLARPFAFHQDTFHYANELLWEYEIDPVTGKTTHRDREPKPDYTLRCIVMTKSARQFFQFARFDPTEPAADEALYRGRVRQIVSRDPARDLPEDRRVVIPGYSNLREFSRAHEPLLKETCGGAWRSYFQRGNWRMILPFSRRHQAATARQLQEAIDANRPPVVHIVSFPSLSINHATIVFAYRLTESGLTFSAYDPNHPKEPVLLTYEYASRAFGFEANAYFKGGPIKVYEIFRALLY